MKHPPSMVHSDLIGLVDGMRVCPGCHRGRTPWSYRSPSGKSKFKFCARCRAAKKIMRKFSKARGEKPPQEENPVRRPFRYATLKEASMAAEALS